MPGSVESTEKTGNDVVVIMVGEERGGGIDGTGQQDFLWAASRLSFILQFPNKHNCCCFGREIKMLGRYRQPSTITLLNQPQPSRPFLPINKWNALWENISTALDRNIKGSLAGTSLRREHNVAIIYCT